MERVDEMNSRTIYVSLAVCVGLVFTLTLLLYYLLSHHRNPLSRLHYGLFVSVLPAVGTLVVLKLTRLSVSPRRAVLIYGLFFLLVFIQFLVYSFTTGG